MTAFGPAWDEARALAHGAGHRLDPERVPIALGDRRFLAAPVVAGTALPPHLTSAMDGWAVAGHGPWRIVGRVLAGGPTAAPLAPGEAVAIATGATPPAGARGVVRSERGSLDREGLLDGECVDGQDLRPAGEEAAYGDVLLDAGMRLTPGHLGLSAAAGTDELEVVRRPTARILVLGDELLTAGLAREGRIRDSLGPQLPAWLDRLGVRVLGAVHVDDSLEAHVEALAACTDVDVVITTGGTAAGPVDRVRGALEKTEGQLLVDSVAVRPGHPMLFGRWGERRWLVGLPGNPQAAVVALLTLGSALVDSLHGVPLAVLPEVTLRTDVRARPDETRLVLAVLDGTTATPVDHRGSAMLRGLVHAHGFAVVPPGGAGGGQPVRWLALP